MSEKKKVETFELMGIPLHNTDQKDTRITAQLVRVGDQQL